MFPYVSDQLVPGFDIRVALHQTSTTLDTCLTTLKPSQVILLEPHLDYMRALEVHSSERKLCGDSSALDVLVIRYEDSVEFYQHMSSI